jgi:arginyl-tRNA synthetase
MAVQNSIRQKLTTRLQTALSDLKTRGVFDGEVPNIQLGPPKQANHGDFATPVALALAKAAKKKPHDIAKALQETLGNADGLLEKSEIAGPGFLNLFVAREAWLAALGDILTTGEAFVRSTHGQGARVLIEFVSANPTGPLHIAHGRGAVTGDVVANLLDAAGYKVEREYYINDLGNQIDIMARSIFLRYGELFGRGFTPPEDFYPGDYIIDMAKELRTEVDERFLDKPESEWLAALRARGVAGMLRRIRTDLDAFGVRFDHWVSESELSARIGLENIVTRLETAGHVYTQEGKKWFRSTTFGDDKDRVVMREDGRPTYFATDIAYHDDKMQRGFQRLINVWGADHGGYVTRVKAGMQALGHDPTALHVIFIQMVSLSRGGDSVRMGKRLGTAVWLNDVVREAGRDATRYFFVMRRSDSQLDFDIELATKKSLDNPVYYAQMGHARMCSIERRAVGQGIALPKYAAGALAALTLPEELDMVRTLVQAPEVVAEAADANEPHLVVHYIQNLIGQFHSYYTRYKSSERVISDDPDKTRARLLLCHALRTCLRALLEILGVSAPERMTLDEAVEESE